MNKFLKAGVILLFVFSFFGLAFASLDYEKAPDGTKQQVDKGRASVFDVSANTPVVANVSMTSANTEYSYTIPDETRVILFKLRGQTASAKISFTSGQSGTTYFTVPANSTLSLDNTFFVSKTLYFQSSTSSQVAEIIALN